MTEDGIARIERALGEFGERLTRLEQRLASAADAAALDREALTLRVEQRLEAVSGAAQSRVGALTKVVGELAERLGGVELLAQRAWRDGQEHAASPHPRPRTDVGPAPPQFQAALRMPPGTGPIPVPVEIPPIGPVTINVHPAPDIDAGEVDQRWRLAVEAAQEMHAEIRSEESP